MRVYCNGKACIRHSRTEQVYEIESVDLDWDQVGGEERQMGAELHYEAIVDHPDLGILTWGLWEYPIGVENYQDTDVGEHTIISDFDFGLEHEEPMPDLDEWVDYSVPDDPFTVFTNSYYHTGDMLADYRQHHSAFIMNRMVFSHQITAMEAYLSDTLIKAVSGNKDAIQRLIEQDSDLMNQKFTLVEISKDPTLVNSKVREHLRSILYHNLAKVNVIYRIALGIEILKEAEDKSSLFKAVMLRHDCVHRNGYDKDGNELQVFSKEFVQETADLIRDFVNNVEKAIRKKYGARGKLVFTQP